MSASTQPSHSLHLPNPKSKIQNPKLYKKYPPSLAILATEGGDSILRFGCNYLTETASTSTVALEVESLVLSVA